MKVDRTLFDGQIGWVAKVVGFSLSFLLSSLSFDMILIDTVSRQCYCCIGSEDETGRDVWDKSRTAMIATFKDVLAK